MQPWQQDFVIQHTQRLLYSYQHWTGEPLLEVSGSLTEQAQTLFDAPFVVVSHDTQPDPVFNYGNRKALDMWETTWETLTQMPSRQTAEPMVQEARSRLLTETASQGFSHFSGVRISCKGRRFQIHDGILWNVVNAQGDYQGQAAIYSQYDYL